MAFNQYCRISTIIHLKTTEFCRCSVSKPFHICFQFAFISFYLSISFKWHDIFYPIKRKILWLDVWKVLLIGQTCIFIFWLKTYSPLLNVFSSRKKLRINDSIDCVFKLYWDIFIIWTLVSVLDWFSVFSLLSDWMYYKLGKK